MQRLLGLPEETAQAVRGGWFHSGDLVRIERLSPQKVPKAIHFAAALPRNASGKLLKRELRQVYGGSGSAVDH